MEKIKYLSQQWRDQAQERLISQLSPEKMNFITASMSNIYLNCPDGAQRYLFFDYQDGQLKDLIIGQGQPPKATFLITGDYETFAKITRAELGSQKALMTRKLKLKGNMVKALKLASVADRLNKVLSEIPTEF